MEKERIGFIGLGIMGKRMAANLLAAGYPLVSEAAGMRRGSFRIEELPLSRLLKMWPDFVTSL